MSSRRMCVLQKYKVLLDSANLGSSKSKESNVSIITLKKQFGNFTYYFCGESNEICDICEKVSH